MSNGLVLIGASGECVYGDKAYISVRGLLELSTEDQAIIDKLDKKTKEFEELINQKTSYNVRSDNLELPYGWLVQFSTLIKLSENSNEEIKDAKENLLNFLLKEQWPFYGESF